MSPNIGDQPDNSSVQLSAYEKLRLHNIHRNEAKLKSLGLLRPVPPGRRKGPNRGSEPEEKKRRPATRVVAATGPTRTSGRKRKAVSYYVPDAPAADWEGDDVRSRGTDDESDYEGGTAANGGADDSDEESTEGSNGAHDPPPLRATTKRGGRSAGTSGAGNDTPRTRPPGADPTEMGGITVENARSGRATCRLCRTRIRRHAPRVGMQAWIVGRRATTWQCPPCFLSNLTCRYESSGRSRCKISGRAFGKGELKVGTRSHTATFYFGVDVVGRVIRAVVERIAGAERDVVSAERVDGYDSLVEEDRVRLQKLIDSCTMVEPKLTLEVSADESTGGARECEATSASQGVQKVNTGAGENGAADTKIPQPKQGQKSGAKGKVEWKFGGRLCYGTLLPSKETNSHCYARTHKGNVKTLAKGKGYWSILA